MHLILLAALVALSRLPFAASADGENLGWSLARFQYQGGLCLGLHTDPGPWFPCDGGAGNSCPTELLPCAAPAALWNLTADGHLCSAYEGPGAESACVNIDCDSAEPGAVVKRP
jgi:hypothetical protein